MANHSSVRDDGSVAVIQSRTLNTCKAPNGSTAPKYQHSVFTLPATQPTVSRALKARTVSFWGGGTCWRANLQGQLLQFFSVWRSTFFCTSENIVRQPYALQCAVTGCLPHWGTWGFTSHRFLLQCAGARIVIDIWTCIYNIHTFHGWWWWNWHVVRTASARYCWTSILVYTQIMN